MKISASITDFPVFSTQETFFKEFQKAGVGGIELVLGPKSRWNSKGVQQLCKKYNLSITSIHQPPWSGVGLYFDEHFVEYAKKLGTNKIVCHPLTFHEFDSPTMRKYFEKLSKVQEKYDVHIMVENMPNDFAYNKLHQFRQKPMVNHIKKLEEMVDEYGLLMTYDVSHAEFRQPQNEKIFQEILPKVGNIHLSSFRVHKHHLPLNLGEFDSKGFIHYLQKMNFAGLITLEVYSPKTIMIFEKFNFEAIRNSVAVFNKIIGK